MKKKFEYILLIDDDEAVNYLNMLIIKQSGMAERIEVMGGGQQALQHLKDAEMNGSDLPDLIFLDINMPVMNGWGFLKEYEQLSEGLRENITLVMLTSSINPDDEHKSRGFSAVKDFKHKPLTHKMLSDILEAHFVY